MGSASDLDFWLGDWRVTWDDGASHGRNSIRKEYGGKVVYERFDGRPGVDLQGMSVSVYREDVDRWFQTWVDDWGNYYDLEGRFEDGELTLLCEQPSAGGVARFRMRFFEIEGDRFTWSWEQSPDGESWRLLWQLAYERLREDGEPEQP